MSSSSARATSSRWSWPPLSWWGNFPRTSPGLSDTDSSAASRFAFHSSRLMSGKNSVRIIQKTRSILKMGLYELNGSWKTPCTCR